MIKMVSKKARLSESERFIELWHEEESLWYILSDSYKSGKKRNKEWKNVGKTRNVN